MSITICEKVHGVINNSLGTCGYGSSLSSCSSNEEFFLSLCKNKDKEIQLKVGELIHARENTKLNHKKSMQSVAPKGKCPDNTNEIFELRDSPVYLESTPFFT